MRDPLRTVRYVVAATVLLIGLPLALATMLLAGWMWASPREILAYDVRPYPPLTAHGQLVYYWTMVGGWVAVWLSGLALVGRWSDRRATWLRLTVLVLPLALAAAVFWMWSLPKAEFTPIASVRGLGNLVRIQFPPGTQLIEAKADLALVEWKVKAKLRMPKSQVVRFIHGPFYERLRPVSPHMSLSISRSSTAGLEFADRIPITDWHPERLRKFITADVGGAGQYVCCLVADTSEPQMSTVYFVFAVF